MAVSVVELALKVQAGNAKKELKLTAAQADGAARSTSNFGKTSAVAMKQASTSAALTRKQYMALRKDSANLDRLTGELASAFALLSPEMSSAASTASAFAGGLEGVARIFTVVSTKMLFAVGAVGAIAAAYKLMTASTDRAAEKNKKLSEVLLQTANDLMKMEAQAIKAAQALDKISDANNRIGEVGLDLGVKNLVLTGQITKEAGAKLEADKKIEKIQKDVLKSAKAQQKALMDQSVLDFQRVQALERMDRIAKEQGRQLSKTNRSKLNNLRKEQSENKKNRSIIKEQINDLKSFLADPDSQSSKKLGNTFIQAVRGAKDALIENIKINAELEKTRKRQERIAKSKARRLAKQREITKAIQDEFKELDKIKKSLDSLIQQNSNLEKSHVKAAVQRLQTEAQTLRLMAERQEGNAKNVSLVKAINAEQKARTIELKSQNNELDKQENTTVQTIQDSLKRLETARANLELLKEESRSKELIFEAENKLQKATQNNLRVQEEGQKKLLNIEKQRENNKKQAAAEDAQREEIALKQKLDNEKKREAAILKVNDTIQKNNKKINDAITKDLAEKMKKRQETIMAAFDQIGNFVNQISDPGSIVQGLSGAIGSAFGGIGGAIGGAVGGLIGGISELGKKSPEEIKTEFQNFLEAFQMGLEMLPELIVSILPRFAIAIAQGVILAIPNLLKGIADQLIILGKNIIEGMRQFFEEPQKFVNEKSKEEFSRISKVFDKYFGISFENQAAIKESFGFRSGGKILSARQGMRVTSGSFGASQLAMVHPGEIITPQSGSRPQAIDRTLNQMSGGQGVTVVINSAVTEASAIDGLVRKIEQRFGSTFGSAKSPLFG